MNSARAAAFHVSILGIPSSSFAQTTECIDVNSIGNADHCCNYSSAMSADGRYVAFISSAPDLRSASASAVRSCAGVSSRRRAASCRKRKI